MSLQPGDIKDIPRLDVKAWALLALGVGLASGCATGDPNIPVVMERMAEEYNCRQGEMAVTAFAANGYRVSACGYTANDACTSGRNVPLTCSKEADSSPVPRMGMPSPDAGTRVEAPLAAGVG